MDLGITTYIFLLTNCLLLILGLVRLFLGTCTIIISVFVFVHMKEVTFSSLIGDTIFLGTNEEAMFILGILAGFKNNVRLMYTYQIFIGLLAISKVLTLQQTQSTVESVRQDISLFIYDIMSENRANNLYTKKVDDVQSSFRCCGLNGPQYWSRISNYTVDNLPRSCCQNQNKPCSIENAWDTGCLSQMHLKFPDTLFAVHSVTLYPLFEVILFLVGILLIILIKKTALNTLA